MIAVLYVLVFGTITVTLGQLAEVSGGYGILDFDRGYSVERVNEVLGSYGDEGMRLYARIQLLDLFNPMLYSLLAACFVHLLWKGRGPEWIALVPLSAGLGDYLENGTLFLLVQTYPNMSPALVALSSGLSLLKNGLLVIAVLPLLAGVWMAIVARLRNRV